MFSSSQILGARPRIVHGLVASVVALAALTGCGQKGALYMPVPPAAQRTPAPAAPAALPAAPASAAR